VPAAAADAAFATFEPEADPSRPICKTALRVESALLIGQAFAFQRVEVSTQRVSNPAVADLDLKSSESPPGASISPTTADSSSRG
jgi:hypothetical protein